MRVTNNMIVNKTKTNVNSNKVNVDRLNTQMTTQQKISKASDDPVIAMRSLRLATSLNHLNQYNDNNIPDAESWLDVTFTAMKNMNSLLSDIRTQCVNGSNDTLTPEDRNTIWKQLTALSEQVYAEGNADYAGRTVFTGYRTTSQLMYKEDEQETTYEITQKFTEDDLKTKRYYTSAAKVPDDASKTFLEDGGIDTEVNSYSRLRLAYDGINVVDDGVNATEFDEPTLTFTDSTGADVTSSVGATYSYYKNETEWQNASTKKVVGDDEIVVIGNTGEVILGKNVSEKMKLYSYDASITYNKKGFKKGEVRPEYYYDCKDITEKIATNGVVDAIEYTKEDQTINYTVAANTQITINTQADQIFSTDILRDVNDMIDIIQETISAHDKVDKIESMIKSSQYADEDSQKNLKTYLEAAKKEAAYADDNLQKTYSQYITNFEEYEEKVNLAVTNLGSTQVRLKLIKTRVENQKTTVDELKTNNDDRDLSDIIIDFYQANNAYQASLTAAARVGKQTLLDYL